MADNTIVLKFELLKMLESCQTLSNPKRPCKCYAQAQHLLMLGWKNAAKCLYASVTKETSFALNQQPCFDANHYFNQHSFPSCPSHIPSY